MNAEIRYYDIAEYHLLLCIINVSVKTIEIVKALPKLKFEKYL